MPKNTQPETITYQVRLEVVRGKLSQPSQADAVHEFLCLAIYEQDQIAWDWLLSNVTDIEIFVSHTDLK